MIVLDDLVDDLACSLELLGVPQESRATYQIFVASVFFPLVKGQDVGVD